MRQRGRGYQYPQCSGVIVAPSNPVFLAEDFKLSPLRKPITSAHRRASADFTDFCPSGFVFAGASFLSPFLLPIRPVPGVLAGSQPLALRLRFGNRPV